MAGARAGRSSRQVTHGWNGVVLYSGPSEIDGAPIIAVITGIRRGSSNIKTGPLLQTWILRSDVSPVAAVKTGADRSVCGDCALRNGACYVTLHHGPRAVFSAYHQNLYPTVEETGLWWAKQRAIRFGSYGDPAAVPAEVWYRLASHAAAYTGYTHAWKLPRFQHLRFLLMASVDTAEEAWEARALQWRTYRVRLATEALLPFESICPASIEGGKPISCFDCRQCDGARLHDVRRHYAVVAHGSGAGAYRRSRLPIL